MRNDRPEHHEEHHDISHHSNGRRTPDRTGPVARGARATRPSRVGLGATPHSLLRVLGACIASVSQAAVSFVSHRVARDTRPRRDRPDLPMPPAGAVTPAHGPVADPPAPGRRAAGRVRRARRGDRPTRDWREWYGDAPRGSSIVSIRFRSHCTSVYAHTFEPPAVTRSRAWILGSEPPAVTPLASSGGRSTSRTCYDYAAVPVACPTHALALGHTPERVSARLAHDAITVKVRRIGLPHFSLSNRAGTACRRRRGSTCLDPRLCAAARVECASGHEWWSCTSGTCTGPR